MKFADLFVTVNNNTVLSNFGMNVYFTGLLITFITYFIFMLIYTEADDIEDAFGLSCVALLMAGMWFITIPMVTITIILLLSIKFTRYYNRHKLIKT